MTTTDRVIGALLADLHRQVYESIDDGYGLFVGPGDIPAIVHVEGAVDIDALAHRHPGRSREPGTPVCAARVNRPRFHPGGAPTCRRTQMTDPAPEPPDTIIGPEERVRASSVLEQLPYTPYPSSLTTSTQEQP